MVRFSASNKGTAGRNPSMDEGVIYRRIKRMFGTEEANKMFPHLAKKKKWSIIATLEITIKNDKSFHYEHISATVALEILAKQHHLMSWHFKSTKQDLHWNYIF